jgi:hypothetical protein
MNNRSSEIKKVAAVRVASDMLTALDKTAEDFEKQGNRTAAYQVDLARHFLKKAIEEGELDGIEVPEDLLSNDLFENVIDDDPYSPFQVEDNLDDEIILKSNPDAEPVLDDDLNSLDLDDLDDLGVSGNTKPDFEPECSGRCGGLKKFDYEKCAYLENDESSKRASRLSKMAESYRRSRR